MCARRGSKGGGKTQAPGRRISPAAALQFGAYFFLEIVIFSPSNTATTERSSGLAPRASAQGLGIVTRQLIEPDPALANIKFNSRVSGYSFFFFISYTSFFVATSQQILYKKTSRSPFDMARRVEPAEHGYTSPITFLPRARRGAYEIYELHRFPRRL